MQSNLKELDTILKVSALLEVNDFKGEHRKLHRQAKADLERLLLLGEFKFNHQHIVSCEKDMLQILADAYVPSFSYILDQ